MWIRWVADVDHRQTTVEICRIDEISQDCHLKGVRAVATATYSSRIGWIAHVENCQATRLGSDISEPVLNSHSPGGPAGEQGPATAQHGVDVNRDGAEGD